MKKSADPFANFVKSIISDKIKQKPSHNQKEDKEKHVETNGDQDGGDLALIMAGTNPVAQSSSRKQDRGGFNAGLGYAPTKSELETATQV